MPVNVQKIYQAQFLRLSQFSKLQSLFLRYNFSQNSSKNVFKNIMKHKTKILLHIYKIEISTS